MDTLEEELTKEEFVKVKEIYQRLKQHDLANVKGVLYSFQKAAHEFEDATTEFMGYKYGETFFSATIAMG